MRIKILIIFVLVLFLLGCVEEGVRVVKVANYSSKNASVAQNQTAANQSAGASSNTTNTTAANTSVSKGKPTKADLAVSTFFLSTIYPVPNVDFEVSFRIKNNGTEPIKDFDYSILVTKGNDTKKSETNAYNSTIDAGSSSSKIVKTFSLPDGTYEIALTLDSSNAFDEANESNNVKKQVIAVKYTTPSNTTNTYNSSNSSSNQTNQSSDTGCTDTDGGLNYEQKGICTDKYGSVIGDVCLEVNQLWEWRCYSGKCVSEYHTCYCLEGRCV